MMNSKLGQSVKTAFASAALRAGSCFHNLRPCLVLLSTDVSTDWLAAEAKEESLNHLYQIELEVEQDEDQFVRIVMQPSLTTTTWLPLK